MKFFKRKLKDQDAEKFMRLQAVERSAQIEGLSLEEAKKNTKVIEDLKKYDRGFSL